MLTEGPGWRYFPELLRQVERRTDASTGCPICGNAMQGLQGPRATLTWCPHCRVLEICEVGGGRAIGIFSPAVSRKPADGDAGAEDSPAIAPSEVPRLSRARA